MKVQTFPQCCGAGVLIIDSLTGRGEKADLDLIRQWVYYARRNGFRMFDYFYEYGGEHGAGSGKAIIGGPGDQTTWNPRNSWGMLLAITSPGQTEAGQRLEQFGFKKLFETINPFYNKKDHLITLWGLDLNKYTEAMLQPESESTPVTEQPRDSLGRFTAIQKAPVATEKQEVLV